MIPSLLCESSGSIDKLSLYLSLKKEHDPCVKCELSKMMEEFQW